jgi:hypothetical protein
MKSLLCIVFFIVATYFNKQKLFAQWIPTNGPNEGAVYCFLVSGSNLFAATSDDGVQLSTDNGTSWFPVNNGLGNETVYAFAASGTNIFAGTEYSGVFLTTNSGNNWIAKNNGLTNMKIQSLFSSGSHLFAGTNSEGLYLSTNNGDSWSDITNSLPPETSVFGFAAIGMNIFAGTNKGIFLSTDNGTSWSEKNNGLSPEPFIGSFAVNGTNIFCGFDGVYLSTNYGDSWIERSNGLPTAAMGSLTVSGLNLFAIADHLNEVYLSTDNGNNWMDVTNGLTGSFASALAVNETYLFAGTWLGVVWKRLLDEFTSVEFISSTLLENYKLRQNHPNPFNPKTAIRFDIPELTFVTLKVFDILGNEIETLVKEEKQAGSYKVGFDGNVLPSGIYLFQLRAGDFVDTKKMVLMK